MLDTKNDLDDLDDSVLVSVSHFFGGPLRSAFRAPRLRAFIEHYKNIAFTLKCIVPSKVWPIPHRLPNSLMHHHRVMKFVKSVLHSFDHYEPKESVAGEMLNTSAPLSQNRFHSDLLSSDYNETYDKCDCDA